MVLRAVFTRGDMEGRPFGQDQAGMGAEGLAFLGHTIEAGQTAGLQSARIEGMGFAASQRPAADHQAARHWCWQCSSGADQRHWRGGHRASGCRHAAIKHLAGLLLRQPTLGATTIAELDAQFSNRTAAIMPSPSRVMNTNTITSSRPGPFRYSVPSTPPAPHHAQGWGHIRELLLHVDERAGPVASVVSQRGQSHSSN